MLLSEFIKTKRAGKYTQRELAELVGISHTYISKLESGMEINPSDQILCKLADVLAADENEIFILAGKIPPILKPQLTTPSDIKQFLEQTDEVFNLYPNKQHNSYSVLSKVFRFVFNNVPAGVLVTDISEGKVLLANELASTLFDIPINNLVGMKLSEFISDINEFDHLSDHTDEVHNFTTTRDTLHGKRIVIEHFVHFLNIEDRPYAITFHYRNSLLESLNDNMILQTGKFNTLFESANYPVYIIDYENFKLGNYIRVNQSAIDTLGYSYEEFLAMTPRDIDHDSSRKYIASILNELNKHNHVELTPIHIAKDGSLIPFKVYAHVGIIGNRQVIFSIAFDLRSPLSQ